MLDIQKLTVSYGSHKVVDSLSFHVEPGKWLMIVGPNGAGKSTVLNAITQGVAYTGDILLNGKDIRSMKPALRARDVGVLAQNHFVGYDFPWRRSCGWAATPIPAAPSPAAAMTMMLPWRTRWNRPGSRRRKISPC